MGRMPVKLGVPKDGGAEDMTCLEVGSSLSCMPPNTPWNLSGDMWVCFGICIDWFGLMLCGDEVAKWPRGTDASVIGVPTA